MNWVGGARSRIRQRSDKKKQQEYFEKRRFENKSTVLQKSNSSATSGISQDILAMNTISDVNSTKRPLGSIACKTVNLDNATPIRGSKYHSDSIELGPLSPGTKPSSLDLHSGLHFGSSQKPSFVTSTPRESTDIYKKDYLNLPKSTNQHNSGIAHGRRSSTEAKHLWSLSSVEDMVSPIHTCQTLGSPIRGKKSSTNFSQPVFKQPLQPTTKNSLQPKSLNFLQSTPKCEKPFWELETPIILRQGSDTTEKCDLKTEKPKKEQAFPMPNAFWSNKCNKEENTSENDKTAHFKVPEKLDFKPSGFFNAYGEKSQHKKVEPKTGSSAVDSRIGAWLQNTMEKPALKIVGLPHEDFSLAATTSMTDTKSKVAAVVKDQRSQDEAKNKQKRELAYVPEDFQVTPLRKYARLGTDLKKTSHRKMEKNSRATHHSHHQAGKSKSRSPAGKHHKSKSSHRSNMFADDSIYKDIEMCLAEKLKNDKDDETIDIFDDYQFHKRNPRIGIEKFREPDVLMTPQDKIFPSGLTDILTRPSPETNLSSLSTSVTGTKHTEKPVRDEATGKNKTWLDFVSGSNLKKDKDNCSEVPGIIPHSEDSYLIHELTWDEFCPDLPNKNYRNLLTSPYQVSPETNQVCSKPARLEKPLFDKMFMTDEEIGSLQNSAQTDLNKAFCIKDLSSDGHSKDGITSHTAAKHTPLINKADKHDSHIRISPCANSATSTANAGQPKSNSATCSVGVQASPLSGSKHDKGEVKSTPSSFTDKETFTDIPQMTSVSTNTDLKEVVSQGVQCSSESLLLPREENTVADVETSSLSKSFVFTKYPVVDYFLKGILQPESPQCGNIELKYLQTTEMGNHANMNSDQKPKNNLIVALYEGNMNNKLTPPNADKQKPESNLIVALYEGNASNKLTPPNADKQKPKNNLTVAEYEGNVSNNLTPPDTDDFKDESAGLELIYYPDESSDSTLLESDSPQVHSSEYRSDVKQTSNLKLIDMADPPKNGNKVTEADEHEFFPEKPGKLEYGLNNLECKYVAIPGNFPSNMVSDYKMYKKTKTEMFNVTPSNAQDDRKFCLNYTQTTSLCLEAKEANSNLPPTLQDCHVITSGRNAVVAAEQTTSVVIRSEHPIETESQVQALLADAGLQHVFSDGEEELAGKAVEYLQRKNDSNGNQSTDEFRRSALAEIGDNHDTISDIDIIEPDFGRDKEPLFTCHTEICGMPTEAEENVSSQNNEFSLNLTDDTPDSQESVDLLPTFEELTTSDSQGDTDFVPNKTVEKASQADVAKNLFSPVNKKRGNSSWNKVLQEESSSEEMFATCSSGSSTASD